jgi:predicted HAD superfamily Cof-like phosphohydrolase
VSRVREFHVAFGQPAPAAPPLTPSPDLVRLRMRLIREEYEEVMAELTKLMRAKSPDEAIQVYRDLLKELSDLRYVVEGCAVALGLPIEEAYAEVHRSNMSKLDTDGTPVVRSDGKALKGPLYTPADMQQFVPDITDHQEEEV